MKNKQYLNKITKILNKIKIVIVIISNNKIIKIIIIQVKKTKKKMKTNKWK